MSHKFFETGCVFVLNIIAIFISVFDNPVLVFDESSARSSIGVPRPTVNLSVREKIELLTIEDVLIKGLVFNFTSCINLNLTTMFVLFMMILDVDFSC
jgi:hypothetical protein